MQRQNGNSSGTREYHELTYGELLYIKILRKFCGYEWVKMADGVFTLVSYELEDELDGVYEYPVDDDCVLRTLPTFPSDIEKHAVRAIICMEDEGWNITYSHGMLTMEKGIMKCSRLVGDSCAEIVRCAEQALEMEDSCALRQSR